MADYSIAAQIKPPQFADPMQMYAQMQQLQTNMLAAQRLRQQMSSENQLRSLLASGNVNLSDPTTAARLGAIDPDLFFKASAQRRQEEVLKRQAEAEARRAEESAANVALRNQDLILKHGDTFRQALGRIESFPENERAAVYNQLRGSLPPDLQRQFPAQYSPSVVQRGMMTVDQLIAASKEAQPTYQELPGNVPGEYVPGQGVRPLNVLPAPGGGIPVGRGGLPPEQTGVPSYPVPAGRQAAMNAAAQRFAPELMGAAPAPAPAVTSPFGAPAAPSAVQPMTSFDLAQRAREQQIQLEADKTRVREQAQAQVKREEARPKVEGGYIAAVDAIDRQLRAIRDLRTRPIGTFTSTGPIAGTFANPLRYLPGDPAGTQAAQARIDTILSQGTLNALTDLRRNSPTGGAVGSVSDKDIELLRSSIGSLSQRQGTADFYEGLNDLERDLVRARGRLRDAFVRDYGQPPTEPKDGPLSKTPVRTGDMSVLLPDGRTVNLPSKAAADKFMERVGQ